MKITMKRFVSISLYLLSVMLILNISHVSLAAESSSIDIIIKGNLLEMNENPILKEDRTYIPIRYFAEALDFKVKWIEEQQTAKLTNSETTILIPIGQKEITLNGNKIILDEKSFIEKGRTYIPLRAVAQLLTQNIQWDQKNKTAIVGEFTYQEYSEEPLENHYLYVNNKYDFNINIPNELKDKLVIKEENDGTVGFYDKYNYEIEENTGVLFSIIKTRDPGILYIIPSHAMKYVNGDYYIAYFASDVQYIVGDEKSTDSYMKTLKLSKEFLKSFALNNTSGLFGENYNRINEYLRKESIATWSKYYELLDFQISNYEEEISDGNVEATFYYKIIEKNYDKDPDTVKYIKEAKESGDKYYQTYYDEYLKPRDSYFEFKTVINKDNVLTLYSNVDPNGIQWEKTNMTDYIIKD